ncbi:MAG: FG-GAP-like repeat-containing protein [Bacteroidota bacterium]|nr:FG-GAP-like repeat-containing protein [Bacteroidota bacterium]
MNQILRNARIVLFICINTLFAQIPTTNLSLWLRADAGLTTTTGSVINSNWTDQSPNGLIMTRNGSPTLVTISTLNGQRFVRSAGAYFTLNSGVFNFNKLTFFAVANISAGDIFYRAGEYGFGIESGSSGRFYINSSASNKVIYPNYFNNTSIFFGSYNLNSITGSINTTTLSPFVYNGAMSSSGLLYIGNGYGTLTGDLAELIMYNGELTPSERTQVYNYLSTKYNIGILPNAPQISAIGTQSSSEPTYVGTRVSLGGCFGTGDIITVRGINFSSVTGVSLNGNSISGITFYSSSLIGFTLPDASTYPTGTDFTGNVSITNPFGTGVSPLPLQVIYCPTSPASVISAARSGSFAVSGSDLSQISSVTIGGFTTTGFYDSFSKTYRVTIPPTMPLGNQTVTLIQNTVLGPQPYDLFNQVNIVTSLPSPIITNIAPQKAAAGSLITINGSNFGSSVGDNIVNFGAVKGLINSASSTQITAIAPVGLTHENTNLLNQNSGLSTQYNIPYYNTFTGGGGITTNTFAPYVSFTEGYYYGYFSAIGDLNNDGRPEIITSHFSNNVITILQNASTGNTINGSSFQSYFTLNTSSNCGQVIIKDFDNDSRLDIGVFNFGGQINIFRNISNGGNLSAASFATPVVITVPVGGYAFDAGDMDADGKLDLVVAAYGINNNLYLYKNQFIAGTITGSSFASAVTIGFGTGAYPFELKVVDVDNDGKPDITTINKNNSGNSTISVFRNIATTGVINTSSLNTPVTFTLPNTASTAAPDPVLGLEFADFDSDGKLDIVASNPTQNSISIFKNKTSVGTINSSSFNERYDYSTALNPYGVAVGDLTGDGKIDIAVASYNEAKISLLRNISTQGTLTGSSFSSKTDIASIGTTNLQPQIVDMDGDSKPEVVVSNYNNFTSLVFRNLIDNPASITGFSPSSGLPLSQVTLTGNNFNNVTQVRMGTITGGSILAVSSNYIVVRIPAGAASNNIYLVNNSGSEAGTSGIFTITGATPYAVITSVSPINASLGSSVVIQGSGFDAIPSLNNVWFGATKMPVTSATLNQMVVSVVGGASSSKITYQNAYGLNDQWKLPFGYSFNGGNIASGSFTNNATLNTGSLPYNVISNDLDSDGKPDLIATNWNTSSNHLSVYRNNSINGTITASSFALPFNLSGYTASNPFQAAVGDLDGDGKPEIVLPFYNTGYFTIFKNNSSPTTLTAASFSKNDIQVLPTGYGSYGSAIADIDNDGFNDIVFSSYLNSGIFIYRNLGNGRLDAGGFQFTNFWTTGGNPSNIQISDIDSDGKLDILVGNTSTTYFSIFRNISTVGGISASSLATRIDLQTPNNPYGVTFADLNSDGKPEIINTNYSTNQISIFQNNCSTSTITASNFSRIDLPCIASSGPYGLHSGDLDGDGKPEIVVTSQSVTQYSVFKNNFTAGNISSSQFSRYDFNNSQFLSGVELVDLDLDGKQEIVTANTNANTINIFKNQIGNGQVPTITGFNPSSGLALSTFVTVTGNGFSSASGVTLANVPVASFNVINANTMVFRVPNSTISGKIGIANQFGTVGLSTADFTVTGAAPIPNITNIIPYSGNTGSSVVISGSGFDLTPNNNIVFFGAMSANVVSASANSLTVTVPNGATNENVRVSNISSGLIGESYKPFVTTFPNSGTITGATFAPRVDIPSEVNVIATILADLDGDGKNDLIASNYNYNTIWVYRNTGTGANLATQFAPKQIFTTGSYAYKMTTGDIDGDGKIDLVVSNYNNASVSIFKNTSSIGGISLAPKVDFITGTNPTGVKLADLDKDGALDLIVANYNTSGFFSVFKNTNILGTITGNTFASRQDFTCDYYAYDITVGDIDKDGLQDIAIGTQNTNIIGVFKNISSSGSISFNPKVSVISQFYPWDVKLSDIDGDDFLDLVVSNSSYSTISVLRNTGTIGTITASNFAARQDYNSTSSNYSLALCDIDGDGKIDITNASNGIQTVSVLRNVSTSGGINVNSLSPKIDFQTNIGNSYYHTFGDITGDGLPEMIVPQYSSGTISIFKNMTAPNPTITGFSPQTGTINVDIITVSGFGLNGVTKIQVGSGLTSNVTSLGSNTLIFKVPLLATTGLITATNSFNASSISIATFTVLGLSPLPIVTSVSPINTSNSDIITLSGSGFGTVLGQNVVYIGAERVVVQSVNQNQITVQNQIGTNNGAISVINTISGLQGIANQFVNNTFSGPNTIVGASFAPYVSTTTNWNSYISEIADLDGDGKNDLISAGYGNNSISVFRNVSSVGGFSFATRQDFTVGTNPFGLAVADFDNDGRKDIAVGNYSSGNISLFKNISTIGNIAFATRVDIITTSFSPYGFISSGDLDGDGFLDLAISGYYNSSIVLLKNQGIVGTITGASFGNRFDITGYSNMYDAQIVDVDGDNKNDLVFVATGSNILAIRKNIGIQGDFSLSMFAPAITFGTSTAPTKMTIRDLDRDGKLDVIVTNQSTSFLSVFKNNTVGNTITGSSFSSFTIGSQGNPFGVTSADIDGDGRLDILYGSYNNAKLSVNRNISTIGGLSAASFAPRVDYTSQGGIYGVTEGDIDGDGKTDILASIYNTNTLNIFRNLSGPTPSITGFSPLTGTAGITIVSISGFGFNNITSVGIAGFISPNYTILGNNVILAKVPISASSGLITVTNVFFASGVSNQSFTVTGAYPYPSISGIVPNVAAVGETIQINGSNFGALTSLNDVFFGNIKANVSFASPSSLQVTVPVSSEYKNIRITNKFNQLASEYNYPFNPTFAGMNTITGATYAPKVDQAMGIGAAYRLAVGDIDGDGKLDVITGTYNSSYISIFRNISSPGTWTGTSFAPRVDINIGYTYFHEIELADVDLDGKLDIVVAQYNNSNIFIIKNNSSPGNLSNASFSTPVQIAGPTNTYAVEVADFNNDGFLDLAAAGISASVVSVYLHNGVTGTITGQTYASKIDFNNYSNVYDLEAADFNGDGLIDLASANYTNNNVSILQNSSVNNNISFRSSVPYFVNQPLSIKAVDIDRDGKLDFVTNSYNTSNVYIFKNNLATNTITSTSFGNAGNGITFATGGANYGVDVFDMDGDGKLDVLSGNYAANTVSILRNIGNVGTITSSTLATKVDLTTAAYPCYVLAADLDGDTKPDIIVPNASASNFSIIRNNLSFNPTATGMNPNQGSVFSIVSISGFNLNSINQVSIGGGITNQITILGSNALLAMIPINAQSGSVIVTNSQGSTSTVPGIFTVNPVIYPSVTGISPINAGVGNSIIINGLNFSTIAGNNIVYFGPVRATVTGSTTNLLNINVPSGANYSQLDLLVTDKNMRAQSNDRFSPTFGGSGTIVGSSFATPVTNNAGSSPFTTHLADLDNDGKPEIIVTNYSSATIGIYKNNTTGNTITGTSFSNVLNLSGSYSSPADIKAVDVDHDGRLDLIISDNSLQSIFVCKNTSSGGSISFAAPQSYAVPSVGYVYSQGIDVADIDYDGFMDIVVACGSANKVSVFKHNAVPGIINAATYSNRTDYNTSTNPIYVKTGDFDKDGKTDIIVSNYGANNVQIFRNTAIQGIINASSLAVPITITVSTNPAQITVGDIDGDGWLDFVVGHYTTNQINVYRNNNIANTITGGSFTPTVLTTNARPAGVLLTDLDGDSKVEIINGGSDNVTISVFRNLSSPGTITASSFATRLPINAGITGATYFASGDLDADGKPELIFPGYFSAQLSILKNLQTNSNLPTITSFTPNAERKGRTMTIGGNNFVGVTSVSLNGTTIPYFVQNTNTILTTLTGNASSGLVSIVGFGGSGLSAFVFTVLGTPAPSVVGINPNPVLQGGVITITGAEVEFLLNPITISSNVISNYLYNSAAGTIIATVPGNAISGDVRLATSFGGISVINTNSYLNVTPFLLPTITGFNPTSALPGSLVSALGNNLVSITGFSISGVSISFNVVNSSLITFTVPSALTGRANVINYSGQTQSSSLLQILTAPNPNFGNMLLMDGNNNQINIPDNNAIDFTNSFTAEAYVKFNQITRATAGFDWQAIFTKNNYSVGYGLMLQTGTAQKNLRFYLNGCTPSFVTYDWTSSLNPNVWYHVTVTYDGSSAKIYINGNLVLNTPVSGNVATNNNALTLGASPTNGPYPLDGSLDEVRFWNIPVSISGISNNRCSEIIGNEPGLVAYYRFNEATNSLTALDAGPLAINGTLANFTLPTQRINSTALCYPISTVTSINPNPAIGGQTIVTLNGLAFNAITSVKVGNVNMPNYTVAGNNIYVSVPVTITSGNIILDNGGTLSTSTGILSVVGLNPTISSISPSSERQGRIVSIIGTNLNNATQVSFANNVNATYAIINSTLIVTTVPGGAISGLITVTNIAGIGTGTFNVLSTPSPIVTTISPSFAVNGTLVNVTVLEQEYLQSPITIGGTTISSYTLTGNNLSFTVPVSAISGHVRVRTLYGGISSTTTGSLLTILPPPTITDFGHVNTGVKLASGGCGSGNPDIITITGNGFAPGSTSVTVNNFNVVNYTVSSSNLIYAAVPDLVNFPGQDITGKIRITTPAGNIASIANLTGKFCVITPTTTVGASYGTQIAITGNDLANVTGATIGGINATYTYNSSQQKLYVTVPTNAPSGNVSFGLSQGSYVYNFPFPLYIYPKPTVSGIIPNPAPIGSIISITGIHLFSTTSVSFNNAVQTVISNINDNLITLQVPTGARNGALTIFAIGGNAISPVSLTIAPTVTSINPNAAGVGQQVDIFGESLSDITQVQINGINAPINFKNATNVNINVPFGATSGNLVVFTAGYTSPGIFFTVIPPPVINNILPASAGIGAFVTIIGDNFSLSGTNTVNFNGSGTATATILGPNTLIVQVPGTASTGFITVTNNGGSTQSNIQFVVLPSLSGSFSPITAGLGTQISLFGNNLFNPSLIRFNGVAATNFTSVSSSRIDVVIPPAAGTGPVSVDVTTDGGTSNAVTYTILGIPTISSHTPLSGIAGTVVTVNGTNFLASNNVLVNGATANVQFISSNQLLVTVPSNVNVGVGNIQVQNAGNVNLQSPANYSNSPSSFTAIPTITLIKQPCNNNQISIGIWGQLVKIEGTNFLSGMQISFNGVTSSYSSGYFICFGTYTSFGSNSLYTFIPNGATSGNVTVITQGGTSNTIPFTIIPPPTVGSFSPITGIAGTSVTINGTDFTSVTSVNFNGANASFTPVSSTQLIALVPNNAAAGKISVSAFGGTGQSSVNFTPVPVITSINYSEAPIGSTVRIFGTNLYAPTDIDFSNSNNASSSNNNITYLDVVVPANANNGVISFTNVGGTSVSPFNFIVSTITGLSANTGVAGTIVSLTGVGITSATSFQFASTSSFSIISTATGVVVVSIPGTAESGAIRLNFPNGGFTTIGGFNPTPVITDVSPYTHGTSQSINLIGTNLRQVIAANFGGVLTQSNLGVASGSNRNGVRVPNNALSGIINITVTGGGTASSPLSFTVISITSILPTTVLGGTQISILGANLDNTSSVVIGGTTVAGINAASTSNLLITTVPSNISSGVVVVNKGGGYNDSYSLNLPNATITSVNPLYGPVGTVITIIGNNFTASRNVYLYNSNHNPFSYSIPYQVVTNQLILATITSNVINGNVYVTGQNNNNAAGPFFTLPPTLNTLPNPGILPSGQNVVLQGNNLTAPSVITVGGVVITALGFGSNSISFTMPTTVGNNLLSIGNVAGVNTVNFSFFSFTSLSSTAAVAGTIISFTGTAMDYVNGITFNGRSATYNSISSTISIGYVPLDAGNGQISISAGGYTITHPTTFRPIPVINNFVVFNGIDPITAKSGSTVSLSGTNLNNVNSVILGSGSNSYVVYNGCIGCCTGNNNTSIYPLCVPSDASTGIISASNGTFTATIGGFNFVGLPGTITGVYGAPGQQVTIDGVSLNTVTSVNIGGFAASFAQLTTSRVLATIPNNATISGSVNMQTLGGNTSSSFTAPPIITSFSQYAGATGISIQVNGLNLSGITQVVFNGATATGTNSGGSIQVTIPNGAITGPLQVSNIAGTAVSPFSFNVLPKPTITGISPLNGGEGTLVQINGFNLESITGVFFGNGTQNATFTGGNSNQIIAIAPPGVLTGTIYAYNSNLYPAPAISPSVFIGSPLFTSVINTSNNNASYIGAPGETIVINGSNFTNPSVVLFNGVPSQVFNYLSSSQLQVVVPIGASSGLITVSTSGGSLITPNSFSVVSIPAINAVVLNSCVGANFSVSYTVSGLFPNDNTFYLDLMNGASVVQSGLASRNTNTSGTITATLPMSAMGSYQVRIRSGSSSTNYSYRSVNSSSFNISNINNWLGGSSSGADNWNIPQNWGCNLLPGLGTYVIIPSVAPNGVMPVIYGSASAGTLDISGTLTVSTSGILTLNNNMTIAGSSAFDAKQGSYLFVNGISNIKSLNGPIQMANLNINANKYLTLQSPLHLSGSLSNNSSNYNLSGLQGLNTNAQGVTVAGSVFQTVGNPTITTTFDELTLNNPVSGAGVAFAGPVRVKCKLINLGIFSSNGFLTEFIAGPCAPVISGTPTTTFDEILISNNIAPITIQSKVRIRGNFTNAPGSKGVAMTPGSGIEFSGTNAIQVIDAGNTTLDYSDFVVNNPLGVILSTTNGTQLRIRGNFVNNGSFTDLTNTVSLSGTNTSVSGTGTFNLNNVEVTNTASVTMAAPVNVKGNVRIRGNFVPGGQTISFKSDSTQSISGNPTISLSGVDVSGSTKLVVNSNIQVDANIINNGSITANNVSFTGISNQILDGNGTFTFTGINNRNTSGLGINVSVNLSGDLVNNGVMFVSGTQTITFNGTNQSISGSVQPDLNNIVLSTATSLTLNRSVRVRGNFVAGGNVNTNGQSITFGASGGQNIESPKPITFDIVNVEANAQVIANNSVQLNSDLNTDGVFRVQTGSTTFAGTSIQNIGGTGQVFLNDIINSNSNTFSGLNINTDMGVAGNITNNGLLSSSATVSFSGGNQSITGSGDISLNNVSVQSSSKVNLKRGARITGNFVNNSSNSVGFDATGTTITLSGNTTQTISGTTAPILGEVLQNNSNGININTPVSVTGLTLSGGNITMASNTPLFISSTIAGAITQTNDSYIVGSVAQKVENPIGTYSYPIGTPTRQRGAKVNFTSAASGSGIINVSHTDATPTLVPGTTQPIDTSLYKRGVEALVPMSWKIETSGITGGQYNVTFDAKVPQNTFISPSTLQIVKRSTPVDAWALVGNAGSSTYDVNTNTLTISRTSLTGFSEFAIAGTCQNVSKIGNNKPTLDYNGTTIGANITLPSAISGYQWSKNGVVISTATGPVFNPYMVQGETSALFQVRVLSNGCYTNVSDAVTVTVSSPVINSTEKIGKMDISIYPNPATNKIFVNINGHVNAPVSIKIFDMLGVEKLSQSASFKTNQIQEIDLSELASGIYIVQIKGQFETKTYKLKIQR